MNTRTLPSRAVWILGSFSMFACADHTDASPDASPASYPHCVPKFGITAGDFVAVRTALGGAPDAGAEPQPVPTGGLVRSGTYVLSEATDFQCFAKASVKRI